MATELALCVHSAHPSSGPGPLSAWPTAKLLALEPKCTHQNLLQLGKWPLMGELGRWGEELLKIAAACAMQAKCTGLWS